MPQSDAVNYVRRRDRAVEDEAWMVEFLTTAPVGVLATVENGQPFINTNLFVYDADRHCIYLHTAQAGRTRTNAEQSDARVCFSVTEMGRLLPAPASRNFSVEYAGVVVFGKIDVLDEPVEARHALHSLMLKYAPHLRPGEDYTLPTEADLRTTSIYRITIESWSGKRKQIDGDFPGAYWYAAHPVLPSVQQREASR